MARTERREAVKSQSGAEPYIFERSRPGRTGVTLPECDVPSRPISSLIPPEHLRSTPAALPEVSELDVVRHFTRLSQKNFSIDTNLVPLGSCTMKYNPKLNDEMAALPGHARLHPYAPVELVQGALELEFALGRWLAEICGVAQFTLQPAAGAHGETLGMLMVHAAHEANGKRKRRVLIPDSAHGTNPASAALVGYEVTELPSNDRGEVDVDAFKALLGDDVAALMLTNPNTLGVFETRVREIVGLVHECGGLAYYDGANLNAIAGTTRLGDMGFDIVHVNLHKTFSTPHGGGGPGAGPVGVTDKIAPFLPVPVVTRGPDGYGLDYDRPTSVGKMRAFGGSFGVLLRAYAFLRSHGGDGLSEMSRHAVLNANYVQACLREAFPPAHDRTCMHECVLTAEPLRAATGIDAGDVGKALLDHGFHAPTTYFPLPNVVPEALMIEPTETETKETLDAFIKAMSEINREARLDADLVRARPLTTPVRRLDEVAAARRPRLRWTGPDAQ